MLFSQVVKKIEEIKAMRLTRESDARRVAATKIQAFYRGRLGRVRFSKILPLLRKEQQMRNLCVECEVKVATKRCRQCKDRYCEACFAKIHKKGYRKGHTWEPIGRDDDYRYNENVPDTNSLERSMSRSSAPSRPDPKGDWEEFYDSSARAKYWFNKVTGEASWIKPY